jgi:sec-independent protein translocase protein TatB
LFLLIFESIGTSELILIGIIALIFLGPRKMPDIARKIGRVMADFRTTTNEFKATWEREVNFEDEERALRTLDLEDRPVSIAQTNSIGSVDSPAEPVRPEVREIDREAFNAIAAEKVQAPDLSQTIDSEDVSEIAESKQNWL